MKNVLLVLILLAVILGMVILIANPQKALKVAKDATVDASAEPLTEEDVKEGWYWWGTNTTKRPNTPDTWVYYLEGSRSAKWSRPTSAPSATKTSSQEMTLRIGESFIAGDGTLTFVKGYTVPGPAHLDDPDALGEASYDAAELAFLAESKKPNVVLVVGRYQGEDQLTIGQSKITLLEVKIDRELDAANRINERTEILNAARWARIRIDKSG